MNLATEERHEEVVRTEQRTARLGGTDIFRGALVIITAVVIGGFVVSRGLDQPAEDLTSDAEETETAAADDGDADTDTGADTDTDAVDDGDGIGTGEDDGSADSETLGDAADGAGDQVATPTTVEVPDETVTEAAPEEVVPQEPVARLPSEVKVLVLNAAQTQGVAARGTETLKAGGYLTGAPKNATSQQPSAILWAEGYELDAIAVADVFGEGLEDLVAPLDPVDLPIDDTQEANVIVVVGPDDSIPIP